MSTETTVSRIPRINEPAPEINAKSTHGMIRISDYTSKGKWVMLFSHPADFTPVCTTEFVEFARRHNDFERLNVQPIGVAVDSIYAHIAWIRNIEENFNVRIHFPLIADLDQKVAQTFGMVHEAVSDTATVRAVFFIDPKNTIRALLYYPLNLGRSVDELLRVFRRAGCVVVRAFGVGCARKVDPAGLKQRRDSGGALRLAAGRRDRDDRGEFLP